jgi:endonuclease YncB( thermonuclease family)
MRHFLILCAALSILSAPVFATEHPALIGKASVIDGDTIEIHGERIRLHGIDAPESGQLCRDAQDRKWRCGQKSALALDKKIGRKPVSCKTAGTDRYGRYIGVCTSGRMDLNGWMVRQGWAVAYRKYSQDYVALERSAQQAHLGVWQGRFTRPDEWRKGERLDHSPVTQGYSNSGSCSIKGNISSKGSRIYHLPGTKWYDRTSINKTKGERWFCTEAEAISAGWRRAR